MLNIFANTVIVKERVLNAVLVGAHTENRSASAKIVVQVVADMVIGDLYVKHVSHIFVNTNPQNQNVKCANRGFVSITD